METSSISSGVSGGRIEGSRAASIDLPEPGAPIISRLWPPAAAISSTRLALSWPLTSREVGQRRRVGLDVGLGPRQRLQAREVIDQRQQVRRGQHGHVLVRPGRLGPAGRRADQPLAHGVGADRRRQRTRHGADRGIERQLADGSIALDGVGRDGAHRHHHGERDRQVEVAALLGQVGGREVDRDVLEGQAEADGVQRVAHALAALRHRLVGQADDGEHVLAAAMRTCTSTGRASMPTKATVAICPYMRSPRRPPIARATLAGWTAGASRTN